MDENPGDRKYDREHSWARLENGRATLGITWHAQQALGEIVYVGLPVPGTRVGRGEPYAEIESLKTISDAIAPISGRVVDVNRALSEHPELLNDNPYEAWIVRIEPSDPGETEGLLEADEYAELLET